MSTNTPETLAYSTGYKKAEEWWIKRVGRLKDGLQKIQDGTVPQEESFSRQDFQALVADIHQWTKDALAPMRQ